jgi:hypothetical protein
MWIEARIFIACILMGASMIAWSASPSAGGIGVGEIRIGLAQLCAGDTPESNSIQVPIAASMVGRDVEPKGASELCIVRDSRIDLPVTTIDAHEDKWKVGWVEISFAPKEEAAYNKIMRESAGNKLVLLRGENAVLEFEILRATHQHSLVLRGFDLQDAEAIKEAIVGGT